MKTKILCFLAILFSFYFTNTFAWETYNDVSFQTNNRGELQIKMPDGNIITHTATSTQGLMSGLSNGSITEADIYNEAKNTNSAANSIFAGTSTLSDHGITQGAGTVGHTIASTTQTNTNVGFVCENGWGLSVTRDVPNTPSASTGGGGGSSSSSSSSSGGGGGSSSSSSSSSGGGGGSSSSSSSSSGGGEPAPYIPPAPVISSSSSTSGDSCSYIASWSENWSTCGVTGSWNANGTINCQQTLSWIPNSATASWSCTTDNTYTDGVLTSSSTSCNGSCPASAPQPAGGTETKTISLALGNPTTQTSNAYANNSDTNKIQVLVSGATNQNRAIVGWGNAGKFSGFEDSSNFPSDLVAKTGKALAINHSQDVTSVNPNGVLVEIPVTSKTPFEGKGKISFQAGGVPFVLNNVQYSFKKPFVGILGVKDNSGTWNGTTTLGTTNDYKLTPFSKSTVNLATANYSLEDFTNKISVLGDDIEIQTKKVDTSTLNTAGGTLFNTRINTTASAKNLNQTPGLQIEPPVISYQLGGQSVKYYLSEGDGATDISPIKTAGSEFLGVRVIGGIQGTGKSEFTGQQANISNLYNSDQRTIIRKNAYNYVKNMKSGEIVGGVKYVLGDTTLAGEINYETLVVVDGNVTITDNVNNSKKKFGIIVLKDNYDVNKDIEGKGNIYIKPNVTQINAIIYSDGALISTDNSGKVYSEDSSTRTANLNKQLILNGSVFTRNTIGGAILAGGKYILPGGVKTDDFDQAMVFDLNYVRRGNATCEKKTNTVTCLYKEPFIIKYDSRVQTSPPKLFSK